jgi:hypothetical protein
VVPELAARPSEALEATEAASREAPTPARRQPAASAFFLRRFSEVRQKCSYLAVSGMCFTCQVVYAVHVGLTGGGLRPLFWRPTSR